MNNELKEQLAKAETTVTITPTPLIMEKVGESFRGVYLGLSSFPKVSATTGEIEQKPVAHFYDGSAVRFNMGAQLVRAIEHLPQGISVQIVLSELKGNSKGGKTKIYAVTPLNIERIDLATLFGGLLQITAPRAEDLIIPNGHAQIAAPDTADQYDSMGEKVVVAQPEVKPLSRKEAIIAWNTIAARCKESGIGALMGQVDLCRPSMGATPEQIAMAVQELTHAADEYETQLA